MQASNALSDGTPAAWLATAMAPAEEPARGVESVMYPRVVNEESAPR